MMYIDRKMKKPHSQLMHSDNRINSPNYVIFTGADSNIFKVISR